MRKLMVTMSVMMTIAIWASYGKIDGGNVGNGDYYNLSFIWNDRGG